MCGIAGIYNFKKAPVSLEVLRAMTESIRHRGPDGDGHWVDSYVGLGHRRLAILDLSDAAHQPMATRDHSVIISYNGEVYNYRELRKELEALGYEFFSSGDTEVVLNAYHAWGVDALPRFNGMFALSIWDQRSRELILARDRYGVKPLYYATSGGELVFASEIKAFLTHPKFKASLDKEALLEYFTFQNYFTNRTLFHGVKILPAGSYLKIGRGSKNVYAPTSYWDYHFREDSPTRDHREYVEELDRLFQQAVRRQLVSDVEVGAYLSGGMDSGSVTAIAAQDNFYLKSFTCGFDLHSASGMELQYDEREPAEMMSNRFKTEHYEMVLKAGDMERVLPRLIWHMEEPRVGQSYPNFYVAQLASKFVRVVLSGAGGDELFGGYPWRYYRAVVNDSFEHYVDKYYLYWQRLINNTDIRKVFAPIWKDVEHVWTRNIFRDVFHDQAEELTGFNDYVNHSLYFEAKTFLHGLLVVEDKLSMAHGLETRVPFLDNDLADFAMRIPVHMKLGNLSDIVRLNENAPGNKTAEYYKKTSDGKLILRKLMRKYIPEEIAKREKQGFSAPDASWFRGESMDYVRRALLQKDARIYEFLDYATVKMRVLEHLNGVVNRRLLIWSLLCFEWWLRIFLDGETSSNCEI